MTRSLTYVELDVLSFVEESPEAIETRRFAVPAAYLPAEIDAIPSIRSVSFSPSRISLGEDLGTRASLSVSFTDHKHVMAAESYDSGTFWGKWRARYGTRLRDRPLRWFNGLLGQALGAMEARHFIVDSTDGPTHDGVYSVVAKDVLKKADGDRAQAPVMSNGFLVADITDSDTTATLNPAGIGDAEYPSSGYVAIGGEEICAFTRSGDVLTFETPESPSFTGRGQLGTEAVEHQAGDRVQLVLRYIGEDPGDIIRDLLVNYAGVPSEYIPIATWNVETESFLQRLYTATIAEPVSVNTLVSELIEQAALAVWWDPLTQLIRLRVLRAISTDAARFTDRSIIEGSLRIRDQPSTRISQVWTYFGQRNPLRPIDEADNYRSVAVTADIDSEDDYGGASIKKIFSRWIPFGGRSVATRLNDILIGRFVDPPRRFTFDVYRYGEVTPQLGGGYRVEAWSIQNVDGTPSDAPIQITRLNPMPDKYQIEAEEMLFAPLAFVDLVDRVIIIDSGINSVNLRDLHDGIYPIPTGAESPAITVTCFIEAGAIVGSDNTSTPAFDVGDWPMGINIAVHVRGRIQGAGGDGANGELGSGPGKDGGPALYTRYPIFLDASTGEVWGGGAGGGSQGFASAPGDSGGGGAGKIPGIGGVKGAAPAGNGTTEAGGEAGGPGGGDGGDPGQNGEDGASTLGGDAGAAIDGDSFVTYSSPDGDIRGPQIN